MEGMIGEVRMFAGTFAPKNWAYCAGQTIQISSNTALFSILGTTYGGNGTTTFQLPDLQGRVCVGTGAGPGLTPYSLGEKSGTNAVTLSISQIPAHVHTVAGSYVPPALANQPEETNPASGYFAVSNAGDAYVSAVSSQAMGPTPMTVTVMQTGQGIPHDNQQPYLGMNYVICMYGVYPSRG